MKASTNELLLALRAPNSGWLAALICALEEALLDPDFGEPQRRLVCNLIESGSVPGTVADAANERLMKFEKAVQDLHALLVAPPAEAIADFPKRPKLTLCGSAA